MLREQKWTTCLGNSTVATEQLYQVMVHSVPIESIDPSKPSDVVKLQEQNQSLHPGLKIVRAKWLRQAHAPEKKYSTLVLGVAELHTANQIIRKGLVSNFALRSRILQLAVPHHAVLQVPGIWAHSHELS
ncbi:hypothetical protein M409DRAFT_31127 [Zasmidium cellare ATCC 36951]|uniref:Uncharacterized protein n=1 Tax=Zasmidium cellare ATCC 36951 TaxID=1080233 RepID=A0A6A6BU62_ZASCE|nr:uncharacterized protein M409DRAFT_31127 [Zasmidium cellare ATCC 36951]KAF2158344.1 hypothetical protein M409DRAFT_31127 [Zasmidium cellare ATCC 36951]